MLADTMDTPILFIIFNRPETTRQVFGAIRRAKPKQLFIAADGPRANKPGEQERCEQTRAVVAEIDWPCEVHRKYESANLGCKEGVGSAISWFFQHVEAGIILEDDCLPHPSFFPFCAELLAKYQPEARVMMISGDNFLPNLSATDDSYYASKYAHIWGWATWRRAWQHYDGNISSYPLFKNSEKAREILPNPSARRYWLRLFDKIYAGKIDTWDAQWQYAIFQQRGLCLVPRVNLVSNIGFGTEATHTKGQNPHANLPVSDVYPLIHPAQLSLNDKIDQQEIARRIPTLFEKIMGKWRNLYHG